MWQAPQYPEPGLLAWSSGLVKMAMSNPKKVDAFLLRRAGGDVQVKQQMWHTMMVNPGNSAELKALMLASMITAVRDESTDPAVMASVTAFQDYVRRRRTFVATEARSMYDAWRSVDAFNMNQALQRSSGSGIDPGVLGSSPKDFASYAWQAALPDSAGVVFLDAFSSLSSWTTPAGTVKNGFNPEYLTPIWMGIQKTLEKYDGIAEVLAKTTKFASLGKAMETAGPAIGIATVVVTSAIDLTTAITTVLDKDKAEKKYATIVADADKPYSVRSAVTSSNDSDHNKLLLYWALATEHYNSGPKLAEGAVDNAAFCQRTVECAYAKDVIAEAAHEVGY
jgi:hypothetical protein